MAQSEPGILRKLSKSSEMSFIYAFFFEWEERIFVKVGRSVRPYRRLQAVAQSCPFPVLQAVFCAARSIEMATSFERRVAHRLKDSRTRGEWYAFLKSDGKTFSDAMKECYESACNRPLKWTRINIEQYQEEQIAAANQWKNGRMKGCG